MGQENHGRDQPSQPEPFVGQVFPLFCQQQADEQTGQLIISGQYGVYHFVNEGVCSRFDYVREVLRQAGRSPDIVEPTTLDAFQRDSTPPPYAPLANVAGAAIGIRLRPWQEALTEFLQIGHE